MNCLNYLPFNSSWKIACGILEKNRWEVLCGAPLRVSYGNFLEDFLEIILKEFSKKFIEEFLEKLLGELVEEFVEAFQVKLFEAFEKKTHRKVLDEISREIPSINSERIARRKT